MGHIPGHPGAQCARAQQESAAANTPSLPPSPPPSPIPPLPHLTPLPQSGTLLTKRVRKHLPRKRRGGVARALAPRAKPSLIRVCHACVQCVMMGVFSVWGKSAKCVTSVQRFAMVCAFARYSLRHAVAANTHPRQMHPMPHATCNMRPMSERLLLPKRLSKRLEERCKRLEHGMAHGSMGMKDRTALEDRQCGANGRVGTGPRDPAARSPRQWWRARHLPSCTPPARLLAPTAPPRTSAPALCVCVCVCVCVWRTCGTSMLVRQPPPLSLPLSLPFFGAH